MRTTIVELGGKKYTVRALPIRRARAWREKLAGPFGQLASALEGAGDIQLDSGRDIASLISTLSGTLIGSMDMVLELLFEYSPELADDRDRIEDEAYDDEVLIAFGEVLRLAYPFGQLLALVNGLPENTTS